MLLTKMKKIILFLFIITFGFSLDYLREDVNATSATFGTIIGPSYFLEQDKLTMTIFSWET
jgi:hypothetical protein